MRPKKLSVFLEAFYKANILEKVKNKFWEILTVFLLVSNIWIKIKGESFNK
jgi:hypothetical protein